MEEWKPAYKLQTCQLGQYISWICQWRQCICWILHLYVPLSFFLPSTSSLRTISHIWTNHIQPTHILDLRLTTILHQLPWQVMVEQNHLSLAKRWQCCPIPLHPHYQKIWLALHWCACHPKAHVGLWDCHLLPLYQLLYLLFPHLSMLRLPLLHCLHPWCQLPPQFRHLHSMAPNWHEIHIHLHLGDCKVVHELPAKQQVAGDKGALALEKNVQGHFLLRPFQVD